MIRHYSEVYDLNTKIGEMTILAIHTPQATALKKMFRGHFLNYRKYKVLGANIRMACASQLPLSPDQVGLESGEVDPRDIMNPMLFKACTGENLNALLNQIYNKTDEEQDLLEGGDGSVGEHRLTHVESRRAYYQMLSDPTWRKAHPQQGIVINNLKPFVHKVATTQPFKWTGFEGVTVANTQYESQRPAITAGASGTSDPNSDARIYGFGGPSGIEETALSTAFDATNPSVFVSNGVTPMPWLDTAMPKKVTDVEDTSVEANWLINSVPRVYMGCLIMPPAVSTKFYMRMIIDWKIAFKDWRPAYEIGNIEEMEIVEDENGIVSSGAGDYTTYHNYYHDSSTKKRMDDEKSSFTSNGAESEMVYAS